jgi:DMSO/TMAO reductase YedYZ molybdopterin-dependent catalytic subunit
MKRARSIRREDRAHQRGAGGLDRRDFLKFAAAGAGALLSRELLAQVPAQSPAIQSSATQIAAPAGSSSARQSVEIARFPEKTDLILLTDRPPQLETPLKFFRRDITPNDAFFVRWHVSGIPTYVDTRTFRLAIGGHVDKPLELSIDQLRGQFQPASLVAVGQCSGNSRSFFDPRVTGGQWGNGAVGNAKWTGVRLKDLLDRAGVKSGAVDVSFGGLDRAPFPGPPPFVKSLDLQHASDGDVMVAYAMNDAPLPMLNGFPLRLIVPGWFATYWVKSLNQITVLPEKFKGFWMDKAYRIPAAPDGNESPTQLSAQTVPISRHTVRSLFVRPEPLEKIHAAKPFEIQGIALDAGDGIRRVEVSLDGGGTWTDSKLDKEIGRYSWRRWRFPWTPAQPGNSRLMCRATNAKGETQVTRQWNRSGYQRNVIEHVDVIVV